MKLNARLINRRDVFSLSPPDLTGSSTSRRDMANLLSASVRKRDLDGSSGIMKRHKMPNPVVIRPLIMD